MSNSALNWAFQQRTGSSSAKLVLVTLADLADSKSNRAFPSVAELCFRTELNRKTVITAIASLTAMKLIEDAGDRVGRTKLIPVYKLLVPEIPNGPENGFVSDVKQSRFYHETVPILPPNGPVFTRNGPENGTRTPSIPSLSQKEPGLARRSLSPLEQVESDLSGFRFVLNNTTKENSVDYDKTMRRLTRKIEELESQRQKLIEA